MTQPTNPRGAVRLHDDQAFAWIRGKATFVDGWIQLDESTLATFSPDKEPDPLYEFSAIKSSSDAVQFAERYGLLHHGMTETYLQFRERYGTQDGDSSSFREPFGQWELQARSLKAALRIYELIGWAIANDEGRDHALAELRSTSEIRDYIETYDEPEPETDGFLLDVASLVVANLASPGLQDVTVGVGSTVTTYQEDASPARFYMRPQPADMLGYIYYRLMLLIVGQGPIKECKDCGRVFPVEDKRQIYCSKSCGARARYRAAK